MRCFPNALLVLTCLLGPAPPPPAAAQETVTLPKARLEELERKEKELEKLKAELSAAQGETARLRQEKDAAVRAAAAAAPAKPEVVHISPPLATLPPLRAGEVVDARDLANHYRADASAAAARYGRQRIRVRGEVVGFEKPLFVRPYRILLRGPDRQTRVLCTVHPPDRFKAVFTIHAGTELVGLTAGETRVPLAKIGQPVTIEGRCAGLDGDVVKLTAGTLLGAP